MEKNITVSQGNGLLEGAYNISLDEIRLLYLALSKIDSQKSQPDGLYTLYPAEFQKMFDITKQKVHASLKNAASSLGKKPIFTYEWNEKKKRIDKVERFWFSSIRYDESGVSSDVTIRFSQDVAMYLYELKQQFTQLKIEVISRLDTPFSFRLYSWLMKYKNLSKNMKGGAVVTDPIEIEWMKERAGLTGKYNEYKYFKREVLEPAIDQINAKTDISVFWEPVKKGRNVFSIKFTYVEEISTNVKPIRSRLPRRPICVPGSAKEGEWARSCISVMSNLKKAIDEYNINNEGSDEKITLADLKKWVTWCDIIGDSKQSKILSTEISERTTK